MQKITFASAKSEPSFTHISIFNACFIIITSNIGNILDTDLINPFPVTLSVVFV